MGNIVKEKDGKLYYKPVKQGNLYQCDGCKKFFEANLLKVQKESGYLLCNSCYNEDF